MLALEPEAASIYCKNIPVDRTLSSRGKSPLVLLFLYVFPQRPQKRLYGCLFFITH
jgi:hypothetical protein